MLELGRRKKSLWRSKIYALEIAGVAIALGGLWVDFVSQYLAKR